MSRGGRGASRGGGRRNKGAPEVEDFPDDDLSPRQKKPQPLFPDISLPVPRPPSTRELAAVKHYLSFRKRVRNGPYFATLDPASVADERTGKTLERAGFDPFNDQETYSRKNHKKKRAVPDLEGAEREYALKFFPRELWSMLDPKGKHPLSHTPSPADPSTPKRRPLKRKRNTALAFSDDDAPMKDADAAHSDDDEATQTDDSDPLIPSGRRARTISKAARKRRRGRNSTNGSREKRGLDAEDDFDVGKEKGPTPPSTIRAKEKKRKKEEARKAGENVDSDEEDSDDEMVHDDDGADEDGTDDDDDGEPVDSTFEESDEGEGDDYNAEGYFDDGDKDDEDGLGFGGGGGDEGGEY